MTAKDYIGKLKLMPHPEGGYYRQLIGNEGPNDRKSISSIYYLLENDDFSAFHRLHGFVEIWYYHAGEEINIYVIEKSGNLTVHHLGPDSEMQVVIEPELWFAAEIPSKNGFALVGCAVGPAFSFDKFELAEKSRLMADFPQHSEVIGRLCR